MGRLLILAQTGIEAGYSSPKLTWLEPGHPASDYSCPSCGFWYQLKGERTRPASNVFPQCSRRGVANHTRGRVCSPSATTRRQISIHSG
jgi:predicted RNA-binding Zn-ribbon protein involved in translation (DUF1610 family)